MKSEPSQTIFKSPKWQVKPKLHRYPTKRWGHTSVINKNKIYIYGGKTGKLKEPIYEIDCDTFQSQIIDVQGFPDSRQSHSCSLIKDKLIIWGGCRQEKALNDCISFTIKDKHCYWSQIAQFPTLKQRQSHSTCVLKDKYIFLYGGCNEDDIYEDCWVFNTDLQIWFQLKNITGKFKKRLSSSLTTMNDKIYLFGGETVDETYENQLYCLTFTDLQFGAKDRVPQMKCQLIIPKTATIPPGRSCHSAISYLDRYLIIIAGQGLGSDAKGKSSSILLNDIWCFDTEKCVWESVEVPTKNVFKPRSCFTANLYHNKIYIFGGLISIQNFRPSDQLLVFSFSDTMQKSLQVCNICKLHFKQIQQMKDQKQQLKISARDSFNFGLNNLRKISRMIKNPFDAVTLIIEAYYKMNYNQLIIDVIQGKIIMIQGQGTQICQQDFLQILTKYEFVEQINTEDPLILSAFQYRKQRQCLQIFNYNLKNGCSRLGQTFLFMNKRGVLIDLMLIGLDNLVYCELSSIDQSVSKGQQRSYQIIKNYMLRNNLNFTLLENATFTVIITQLQKISPTQSQMRINGKGYVELVNSSIPNSMNNSNYKKSYLHTYCSTMFICKTYFKVIINSKPLQFKDQVNEFETCVFQPTIQHDLKTVKIKQCQKQGVINIYRSGLRVGQYVKKNAPFIEGYVQISMHYELSLLRHRIQNSRLVEIQILNLCGEFQELYRKRKNQISVHQLQNISRGR